MTKEQPDIEALTFEQAFAQLERVVAQLEDGDLPLDDALALYARGQALAMRCAQLLEQAELRIRQVGGQTDA
jgi:exodeoxyribonuclease VII small subunit